MGKRNKRKDKPSSSSEDSFLEEKVDKHLGKKAKTDTMAGPKTDITLADIMARMDTLESSLRADFQRTVDSLTKKNELLESRIFDLEKDKDSLINRNEAMKNENRELRETVQNQGNTLRDLEQYQRGDNIKVYNLVEKRNGNRGETDEETARAVIDMIDTELKYKLSSSDISIAHRLGSKVQGKERSVIVRFVSRTVRNEVVKRRKALRGKPIVIADDLSPYFQGVFSKLREIFGKNNVWSAGSQVFVKTTGGIKKVTSSNFDSIIAHVNGNSSQETAMTIDSDRGNVSGAGWSPAARAGGRDGDAEASSTRTPPGRMRGGQRGYGRGRGTGMTPPDSYTD